MPEVCLIVPCFNEEHRIRLDDFRTFLRNSPDADLCVVDDGSRDGTLRVLERLRDEFPGRVLVHGLGRNGGKAAAVRAGVRHAAAAGPWPVLGYWDADLATPFAEVDRLLAVLRDNPECQLAMGSRLKRLGAQIHRKATRHVLGRIFASLSSMSLGLDVYDSQCGAKLFRRESVPVFFDEPFLTRWLFDLEILVRLRNAGGDGAVAAAREVPLNIWRETGGSKLRVREMMAVPIELLRIRMHYRPR